MEALTMETVLRSIPLNGLTRAWLEPLELEEGVLNSILAHGLTPFTFEGQFLLSDIYGEVYTDIVKFKDKRERSDDDKTAIMKSLGAKKRSLNQIQTKLRLTSGLNNLESSK
jgi:hypothetical protein